ncbi:protein-export chaperone SecB [Pseudomonas bubulae]|uniref:protein-export chaperone SecB n=1 Tax=Pseudomonas bubulae TaxID=2316085 RepID=UPI002B1D9BB9|nr:protein-export chaperone SecB [Pseudomonas bubulae]
MKINIVENIVLSFSLREMPGIKNKLLEGKSASIKDEKAEFSIKLKFEEESFFVIFSINIVTKEGVAIEAVYQSKFVTDELIDLDFINKDFAYVNAPAIAYPYLRTFISNFTLNAGYSPIMLPSINFVALRNRTKNSNNISTIDS